MKRECPGCQSNSEADITVAGNGIAYNFYDCPICGRFEIHDNTFHFGMNKNHLASYLFYHAYKSDYSMEYRYNTVRSKEDCDRYKANFENGINTCGLPVHMDADIVEAWYPKTISERIDCILLYIANHTEHIGQELMLSLQSLISLLFVDRNDISSIRHPNRYDSSELRDIEHDCVDEVRYMLDYLKKSGLITCVEANTTEDDTAIALTPEGYMRVDELQKYSSYGKSVLVAMKFGNDTQVLREAIRMGITDAGYVPIFIDEVQHNDFITPELLKYIRDSKFVVVDLTHRNNGAYFEEGYAMGLGKPVIQLCKKDVELHFDIAQKNTIIWSTEEDIPERLTNRIRATID